MASTWLEMLQGEFVNLEGAAKVNRESQSVGNDVYGVTTPTWPLPPNIFKFARRLSRLGPLLLSFTEVDPRYLARNCHINVFHRVQEAGGRLQYGWIIWQHHGTKFCEGEFHSVWVDPQGNEIDITPRPDGEESVVFLPDNTRRIEYSKNGDLLWANHTNAPDDYKYTVAGQPSRSARYTNKYNEETCRLFDELGFHEARLVSK